MGIINSTTLATSSPRNLIEGFLLFPLGTTIDNPATTTLIGLNATPSFNRDLLRRDVPLALWRLRSSITGGLTIGAFWGFNLQYTVAGETRADGTASLAFTSDAAAGGVGFGFGFTIGINLRLEQSRVTFTWASGFRTTWERVFNISPSVTVDLIDITLRIMAANGARIPLERIQNVRSTLGGGTAIWGLYASASSQFATRGTLTLRPTFSVSVNLLKLIAQLRAPLKALKKAGGKAEVGPVFNVVFPITISIVRLTTEDGNYAILSNRTATFTFSGGPRIPANAPPVRDVTITHSHSMGLEFTVDFKVSLSVWYIFNFSLTVPINLGAFFPLPPLGINRVLGPFFTKLSATAPARDVADVSSMLPEVVWG